jgi:hypothetical protein
VTLGIELSALGVDARDVVARERRLHLIEHRAQPGRERIRRLDGAQRTVDAVDGLEPIAGERVPCLIHTALDLAGRALAVVVEVGQRALVAVVELRDALLQLADVLGRRVACLPFAIDRLGRRGRVLLPAAAVPFLTHG